MELKEVSLQNEYETTPDSPTKLSVVDPCLQLLDALCNS